MVEDRCGHTNLIKTYALSVKGWWWPSWLFLGFLLLDCTRKKEFG